MRPGYPRPRPLRTAQVRLSSRAGAPGGSVPPDLPSRKRVSPAAVGHPLPEPWFAGQGQACGSSLTSVFSSSGAWRYSSIMRRASSASSSRTRMTVPPTPGKISCCASIEVTSESIPADSSKPCTTKASDSCSVSKTLTSFSFGFGRCSTLLPGSFAIAPPREAGFNDHGTPQLLPVDFNSVAAKTQGCREPQVPGGRFELCSMGLVYLTPHEGRRHYSRRRTGYAHGARAQREEQESSTLETVHRAGRHAHPHPHPAQVCRQPGNLRNLCGRARKRDWRISRAPRKRSERHFEKAHSAGGGGGTPPAVRGQCAGRGDRCARRHRAGA